MVDDNAQAGSSARFDRMGASCSGARSRMMPKRGSAVTGKVFFLVGFFLVTTNAGHFEDATALLGRGQYRAAIELYQQALKENPRRPELFYNLALAYERLGRSADALANYTQAADLGLTGAVASVVRIQKQLTAEKVGRLQEYLETALERKDYRLAQELSKEIMRLDPDNAAAQGAARLLKDRGTVAEDPASDPKRPGLRPSPGSNRKNPVVVLVVALGGLLFLGFALVAMRRSVFNRSPRVSSALRKQLRSLQRDKANGCLAAVTTGRVGLVFLRAGIIVGATVGEDSETEPKMTIAKGIEAFREIARWHRVTLYFVSSLTSIRDNIFVDRTSLP